MVMEELDGLSLEYQRDYGSASGELNVLDLINNPEASGVCRVFGLGLQEERGYVLFADPGSLSDDRTDPLLIGVEISKPLAFL